MAEKLTTARVKAIPPPASGQSETYDTAVAGLTLRVSEHGRRTWCLLYRTADARKRRLTLGTFPTLSLADARMLAHRNKRDVYLGEDPVGIKREGRSARTFGEVAEIYLERWAKKNKRTWREDERILSRDIPAAWKNRKAVDITSTEVQALIDKIAECGASGRGAPIQANRTLGLLTKVYNFAKGGANPIIKLKISPCYQLQRPTKERVRDHTLNDGELRALWADLDNEPAKERSLFCLGILLAARKGELLDMTWSEVDLDGGWWEIPAERAKNGVAHRLPLVGEAHAILRRLRDHAPEGATLVFAGTRQGRPIATIQRVVARVLVRQKGHIRPFRFHDLRRTAASGMASIGIDSKTVGRLLNHLEPGVTEKHYIKYAFDREKAAALTRWSAHVARIVAGEPSPKVVPLNAPAA